MARLGDISIPQELLLKASQGDEAAQAVIYTSTSAATFALIRRLIPNRAVAEDLFQSQLARAHQKLREWFESGQDRQLCTSIQSNSKIL